MFRGFRSHLCDPTDSRGRSRDSNRLNLERMHALGLDSVPEGQLYSYHSQRYRQSLDEPWQDDPSDIHERFSRGYNPNYYGVDGVGRASSAADSGVDRGYLDEDEDGRIGLMKDRYDSYKSASGQSLIDQEAYTKYLGSIPRSKPRKAPPGYYGDDIRCTTTSEHHRELARLAQQTADSSGAAWQQRCDFDLDYIGHYHNNESRRGHLKFAEKERKSSEKAERYRQYHSQYFEDDDDDY